MQNPVFLIGAVYEKFPDCLSPHQTPWIAEGQKVYGEAEHVCSIFVVLLSDGLRSTVPRNGLFFCPVFFF